MSDRRPDGNGVDPIVVSVIQHRLLAIVAEMGEAMLRTAYSQILNSSRDFSTAICDLDGRLIAQAEHVPIHVGALPFAARAVTEFFGDDIHPGDVFLLNDPYHGGNHLPDLTAFVPVFASGPWGDKPRFWSINRAHQSDIGGATHGAYNASATDIWQEGIRITPFQLASLVSMLANGGTQYYLQYPRTEEERENFQPRVRRQFDIAPLLPDLREGMLAAVLYGTARRSYDPDGEQDLGKTGTCNDHSVGGRLGWFVSYADQAHPKIVLVVLLHGGSRIISGPHASEIAGRIYRGLYERNYFANMDAEPTLATYSPASASSQSSTRP